MIFTGKSGRNYLFVGVASSSIKARDNMDEITAAFSIGFNQTGTKMINCCGSQNVERHGRRVGKCYTKDVRFDFLQNYTIQTLISFARHVFIFLRKMEAQLSRFAQYSSGNLMEFALTENDLGFPTIYVSYTSQQAAFYTRPLSPQGFPQHNVTGYQPTIIGPSVSIVSQVRPVQIIRSLHQKFAMTDLGPLNYFLGMSVTRDSSGLFLSQKKYVVEILDRAHMVNCNPSQTPIDAKSKLGSDGDMVADPTLYRSLAGSLPYITFTRLYVFYVVQQVCHYMHDPRDPHSSGLKRILRYVCSILDYGLHLISSSTTDLVAYSDVDWVGCPTTRHLTSGYYVVLGNNLLSWSSKRQPTLYRSSADAEYRGVANTVVETCWLRNLLRVLHTPLSSATLVYCDNVSAVYLSSNPVQHQRTKHIEIDIHFVHDLVASSQAPTLPDSTFFVKP
nr:ribonuclease H-like domain-containing protein [Tanacetum cinerariifolium]